MSNPEVELEVRMDPANHVYFDSTGGKLVLGFSLVLHGFAVLNPSSTVAVTAYFYDGSDNSGNKDIPISLAVSESASDWYGDRGVWFKNGLYLNVTAGEVLGSVFYRHRRL